MSGLAGGATFARLVDARTCCGTESSVALPVGRFRRPLRMRLRVTPWWPGGGPRTLVELLPTGRVPLSRRYFDSGHRLLDRVAEELRHS